MISIYCDGLCEDKNPGGHTIWGFAAFPGEVSGREDAPRPPALASEKGYLGKAPELTTNLAEFTAVHKALEWLCDAPGVALEQVNIRTDSQLVVKLINNEWNANQEKTRQWRDYAQELIRSLAGLGILVKVHWVRGDPDNWVADRLTMEMYAEVLSVSLEEAYRIRAETRAQQPRHKKSGPRSHFKRRYYGRGGYDYD